MNKIKYFLVILPVIAVIVLCGFLPGLALDHVDSTQFNTATTAPLPSVELILEKGPEYFLKRLDEFCSNMIFSDSITAKTTAMAEKDAQNAVISELQAYIDAGLIPPLDDATFLATPSLWLTSNSMITWDFLIKYPNLNDGYVYAQLDDSTGRLLSLQYSLYEEHRVERIPAEPEQTIDVLAQIFFGQHGITSEYFLNIEQYQYSSGSFSFEYTLLCSDKTQIAVQFVIDGNGFSINHG